MHAVGGDVQAVAAKLKNKSENSIKAFYGKHRKRLGLDRPMPDSSKEGGSGPPPSKKAKESKPPRPPEARADPEKSRVDDALEQLMTDEVMPDASPERDQEDAAADQDELVAKQRMTGKAKKQPAVKREQQPEPAELEADRWRHEDAGMDEATARCDTQPQTCHLLPPVVPRNYDTQAQLHSIHIAPGATLPHLLCVVMMHSARSWYSKRCGGLAMVPRLYSSQLTCFSSGCAGACH